MTASDFKMTAPPKPLQLVFLGFVQFILGFLTFVFTHNGVATWLVGDPQQAVGVSGAGLMLIFASIIIWVFQR